MREKIVLIDDAPELLGFYEALLTDDGYEVVGTFTSPPTDPRDIAVLSPDLVITDWYFGKEVGKDVSGMDVLNVLKIHPLTAAIPIIVCTAAEHSFAKTKALLAQLGVRVVHKPFAIDDLLAIIQQVLEARQEVGSGQRVNRFDL